MSILRSFSQDWSDLSTALGKVPPVSLLILVPGQKESLDPFSSSHAKGDKVMSGAAKALEQQVLCVYTAHAL